MSLVFFITVIMSSLILLATCSRRFFDAPFIFTMHMGVLMGIPALLHATGFELPEGSLLKPLNPDKANLELSMIVVLATCGIIAGFHIFKKRPIAGFILPNFDYDRSYKMMFTGIVILTILGFAVALAPLQASDFDLGKTVSSVRLEGFFFSGLNFIRQFIFFGSMLSGAFLIYMLKRKKEQKDVSSSSISVLIFLFLFNLFLSFILGGKTYVIFPLSGTLFAYEICVRKKGYFRIFTGIVIIAFAVISLQMFRIGVVAGIDRPLSETAYNGLYFIVYDTTLTYLEANDTYLQTETGQDFRNSFVAIVPRLLWPEKPDAEISAGNRFARQMSPGKDNPAGRPPYGFAQWFVNYGWFGPILGGLLTGWLLGLVQNRYGNFRDDPFSFIIMWHIIFIVMGPWPGGIHNTSLLNYILYIFPLFIFKWLSSRKLYTAAIPRPL